MQIKYLSFIIFFILFFKGNMLCQTNKKYSEAWYRFFWSRLRSEWVDIFKNQLNTELKGKGGYPSLEQFDALFEMSELKITTKRRETFKDFPDFLVDFKNLKKIVLENQLLENIDFPPAIFNKVILNNNLILQEAEYFNTHEKRKTWWDNLDLEWKRFFLFMLDKPGLSRPTKNDLITIFNTNSVSISNKYGYEIKNLFGISNLTNLKKVKIIGQKFESIEGVEMLDENIIWICKDNKFDFSYSGFLKTDKYGFSTYQYKRARIWWSNLSLEHQSLFLEEFDNNKDGHILNNELYKIFNSRKLILKKNQNLFNIDRYDDLTFIENLTKVRSLKLIGFNLSDLNFLERHYGLRMLDCSNNNLKSLKGIKSTWNNLEILKFSDNDIDDLSPIKKFKKLKVLIFDWNRVSDLEPIKNSIHCEVLMFAGNRVESLVPIRKLVNLEILRISKNRKISGVGVISGFKKLRNLYCEGNDIDNLQFLTSLEDLERLSCDNNSIENLNFLNCQSSLLSLSCSGNQITDLAVLKDYTRLKSLFCNKNKIENLDFITTLDSIQFVYLNDNKLNALPVLNQLNQLEELWISKNSLENINGLKGLKSLKVFSCSYNKNSLDYSVLDTIKSLNNLEELYFFNNGVDAPVIDILETIINDLKSIKEYCVY